MSGQVEKVQDDIGESAKQLFVFFLKQFTEADALDSDTGTPVSVYEVKAKELQQYELSTLYVDYEHVSQYDQNLATVIHEQFYRVYPFLCQGVTQFLHDLQDEVKQKAAKNYYVGFYNYQLTSSLRDMRTETLGQLMEIKGTVTRSSLVRPELLKGTFTCGDCGQEINNIPQQFKYVEPRMCINSACQNRTDWSLDLNKSIFADWQLLRVQEDPNEIPPGSMPRSIKVIVRNEAVEVAKPGDRCNFTGTLIVVPDISALGRGGGVSMRNKGQRRESQYQGLTGLKSLGVRDLTYKLCFLASHIQTNSGAQPMGEDEEEGKETEEEIEEIINMKNTPRLYTKMVASVAPTIFGHEEIKRGILLQLFGGVHKRTADKANLRGDINVCIVGDPSTAKSQFLKYVTRIVPRSVYTSGKASSAAGLTASVGRDPDTGEFTIEAGALMLADHGICCIDEFDKMDLTDQVAIHEAMEQQTISITKAGIQATLNARTAILAAANPIRGRYDQSRTLKQNLDITPPIMSRFDLFFVVLDQCEDYIDFQIATHIIKIHQRKAEAVKTPFTTDQVQRYVKYAKRLDPSLSREAGELLIRSYADLRAKDATGPGTSSYRITVRQLESMIRLSEARARLELASEVTTEHVKEAYRLLRQSIVRVDSELTLAGEEGGDDDDDDAMGGAGGGAGGDDDDQDGGDDSNAMQEDRNEDEKKEVKKAKRVVKVTYSQYKRISNLLVLKIRREEAQREDPDDIGMAQGELVDWYIQQDKANLEGFETLDESTRLVLSVIRRLIGVDHVLLELVEAETEVDRILGVHPNYNVEDSYFENNNLGRDTETTATTEEPQVSQAAMDEDTPETQSLNDLLSQSVAEEKEETEEKEEKEAEKKKIPIRRRRAAPKGSPPRSPTDEQQEGGSGSVRLKKRRKK